jgi:hypothetical protein
MYCAKATIPQVHVWFHGWFLNVADRQIDFTDIFGQQFISHEEVG